jgi:hypothetical protein
MNIMETENVVPKITVMQPSVINVSNPPEQNMASKQKEDDDILLPDIKNDVDLDYSREDGK